MDIEKFAAATFVLIGLVNGIQLAIDMNWPSFIRFFAAVLAGGLFGFLHWFGLPSVEVGLAVGIGSSGVYKTVQKLSGTP